MLTATNSHECIHHSTIQTLVTIYKEVSPRTTYGVPVSANW